ncbi:hypothetical protein ABB37_01808 [Leptomonas pyrrhocoris]|uniref:Uncharacterized protein n=1 Tax=Leptomonas pyrrhocoris TaxID=157538 RepID=A0A0M9G9J9_LEPPY|nr:hypothetical protein ABB37_01808 [Leptomonas pyrrhocoris]KPA85537.1 hypothetical protein ABB37_01808 [Leptomonas pyrrhocoris]|eukprot:XP_015663976.1 hypothetical protein ABB37_01808 [Leptomonas pyrrhocoris]
MSQVVVQLVRRLATPAVASALAKEELCLAFAAVAQLRPFSPDAPDAAAGSSAVAAEPLARRSLRVIPHCTPQELRMIALGASALPWSTTPALPTVVVDALVQGLHRHIANRNVAASSLSQHLAKAQRGHYVRLHDLLAVVTQAMDAGVFFNVTLHELITQHTESLAREGPILSAAAAEELIAVVCAYLGEEEGVALVRRIRAALTASPQAAVSTGVDVLDRCVVDQPLPLTPTRTASYARWSKHRSALLASLRPSSASPSSINDVVDPATTRRLKAQCDVLLLVQRLLRGTEAVRDEDLLKALEEVKVFQIYDPVTLRTLDDALQQRLTDVEKTPLTPAAAVACENVVYAQAQRLPRTLAMLRARDAASESMKTSDGATTTTTAASSSSAKALQHLPVIQSVYQKALAGATVSDKDLFLVGDNTNAYGADEVAQAIFVFAHTRDIPSNFIAVLATTVATLTLDGVLALLRATRHDRAGALRTVVEACLRNSTHMQQCIAGASVASLVALVEVLSQPPTRRTTTPKETTALEAQLRELALAQLHLHVEAMPWGSLLCVVRGIGKLPGTQDTVQAACDRLTAHLEAANPGKGAAMTLATNAASPSSLLGISKYLELVDALQSGDVVNEPLLDGLAAALAAYFTALSTSAADDARHAAFLRFVLLELRYESPELAEVVAGVVQTVGRADDWAAVPTELLVSAVLFTFDRCNVSSFSSSAFALPHLALQHIAQSRRLSESVTAGLATAVVEILSRLPVADADNAAVTYCVQALLPIGASLTPITAARLISVAYRTASRAASAPAVPQELYDAVTEHVRGLPPDIFTSLCLSVSSPSFDEALANRLVEVLPRVADQLTPRQLSRCVFGLGEMRGAGQRLSHQVMSEDLSDYAVDNVELFTSGRDIASLLHGFAKLQCTKRHLYSTFARQVNRRCVRYTLDFNSISFLLFAFGSVKFVDAVLVNSLCTIFVDHADELAAPDLLMTLRGVSRMCLLNSQVYWRLGMQVAERADEFPLSAQCDLIHAYGFIEQQHSAMVAALAPRIAANVSALPSVSAAVDVLLSLWRMDYRVAVTEASKVIADHVVQHSSELSSSDLAKLCSIILDIHWAHGPLLDAIAARSIALKAEDGLEAGVARIVLDTLGSQHVFHLQARTELSQLARSASKEAVQLSGEEEAQLKLLISH